MDINTPGNCTCLKLRKAARAITQAYDEALKPSGLRATQFSLLSVVAEMGPIGVAEIANTLASDRTTITRNLKPLVARKLLAAADGDDARRRPVEITEAGKQALQTALPLWKTIQTKTVNDLGEDRWSNMIADLTDTVNLLQSS